MNKNSEAFHTIDRALDNVTDPEYIVAIFDLLTTRAVAVGVPIRYDARQNEDLTLYWNDEYGKILVDKSFIQK